MISGHSDFIVTVLAFLMLLCTPCHGTTMYLSRSADAGKNLDCDASCTSIDPCGGAPEMQINLVASCTIFIKVEDWGDARFIISRPGGGETGTTTKIMPYGEDSFVANVDYINVDLRDEDSNLVLDSFWLRDAQISLKATGNISIINHSKLEFSGFDNELAIYNPTSRFEIVDSSILHTTSSACFREGSGSRPFALEVKKSSLDVRNGIFFEGSIGTVTFQDAEVVVKRFNAQTLGYLRIAGTPVTIRGSQGFSWDGSPEPGPTDVNVLSSHIRCAGGPFLWGSGVGLLQFIDSTLESGTWASSGMVFGAYGINIDGSTFLNSNIWLRLRSPGEARIVRSTFDGSLAGPLSGDAIMYLIKESGSGALVISANTWQSNVESGQCGLALSAEVYVAEESADSIDMLCVDGSPVWGGQLKITRGLARVPAGGGGTLRMASGTSSHLTLHQITHNGINIEINSPEMIYVVNDADASIHGISSAVTVFPPKVFVDWQSPSPPAIQTYIVMDSVEYLGNPSPQPGVMTGATFSFDLRYEEADSKLYMEVTEVQTPAAPSSPSPGGPTPSGPPPSGPAPSGPPPSGPPPSGPPPSGPAPSGPPPSGPAPSGPPPPSSGLPPPSNPPPVPVGCGANPGPGFTCVNGEWIADSPVEAPVVVIPGGTGTVVIQGDLNVTTSITFSGLGSELFVNGCITIEGTVELELTEQEIQQLLQGAPGGTTKKLISKVGDDPCTNATDLATVPLSIKSPDTCNKLKTENKSTQASLSVLFNVDSSSCKKSSKLVAIVVPSVIGAIVVIAAAAVVTALVLKNKSEKASKIRITSSAV